MLNSVDDACDFIGEWCRESGSHAGAPLRNGFAVPHAILRLNDRIGSLWHSAERQHATPLLGLLDGQDQIVDPEKYVRDKHGVVPFIRENQGVWSYGFDPGNVDQLQVCGDWCDGLQGSFQTEWRPVGARPEDALICTLLINLCLQSDAHWDDNTPKPDAAHLLLWQHPAWSNFDGFWTDDARTLICFSGWQIARR
jgi:hypothetical protein